MMFAERFICETETLNNPMPPETVDESEIHRTVPSPDRSESGETARGETKLTIAIKNQHPIELLDLTDSLLSLGEEYKRFIASNPEFSTTPHIKLYIKEIRTGSVVTDLVALAPLALPFIENATSIIEFSKYLKTSYDYLLGKGGDKPPLEKTDYDNLSKIVEPVAKDSASQVNISTTVNGNVVINFNLNSTEANAAQNTIRRELEQLREPETRVHSKVVLYWYQARGDARSNVGDKGIIESISPSPVKVIFEGEKTKALILLESGENPFGSAYIVDVFVETVNGKPALYKIIEYHDRLEKP